MRQGIVLEGNMLNGNSVRLRQETQSDGQNLYLKSHQHVSKHLTKIYELGAKGVPKSVVLVPRRTKVDKMTSEKGYKRKT